MSSNERDLNHYLFFEFSLDLEEEDESRVSESWPFELRKIAELEDGPVFEFDDDDEPYFAFGGTFNFLPKAGMDLAALVVQLRGARWIGARDPVGLDVSMPGDPSVPSGLERRRALEVLGQEVLAGRSAGIRFTSSYSSVTMPLSSNRLQPNASSTRFASIKQRRHVDVAAPALRI